MILHLLLDEKFSDYVISQFYAGDMFSDFVLFSPTRNLIHFHHIEKVRVVNPYNEEELQLLLPDLSNYNAVVFHGLFANWQDWLLQRLPPDVKKAWVCWGGEIYGQPDLQYTFLKPITKIVYRLHQIISPERRKSSIFPKEEIQKLDYCLCSMNAEYEFVKKYLQCDIKHLRYTYYSIDETVGSLKDKQSKGNNIFIGNSATIENNHLESLLRLKRIGIGERKIVMPLSYGFPWIRNMCLKVGYRLFGKRFTPLTEFILREEYNAKMLDCAVMIQGHLREQAHGNIVTGLWLGMRVYLSEKGIDYRHFKQLGCKVFSIERDLKADNPNALTPLSDDDVAYNRNILLEIYSNENIDTLNRIIVNALN